MGKPLSFESREKESEFEKQTLLQKRTRKCYGVGVHVLGDSNPTSLNYSVFYFVSQSFGTRGRQEHHQIHIEYVPKIRYKSSVRCYGVC